MTAGGCLKVMQWSLFIFTITLLLHNARAVPEIQIHHPGQPEARPIPRPATNSDFRPDVEDFTARHAVVLDSKPNSVTADNSRSRGGRGKHSKPTPRTAGFRGKGSKDGKELPLPLLPIVEKLPGEVVDGIKFQATGLRTINSDSFRSGKRQKSKGKPVLKRRKVKTLRYRPVMRDGPEDAEEVEYEDDLNYDETDEVDAEQDLGEAAHPLSQLALAARLLNREHRITIKPPAATESTPLRGRELPDQGSSTSSPKSRGSFEAATTPRPHHRPNDSVSQRQRPSLTTIRPRVTSPRLTFEETTPPRTTSPRPPTERAKVLASKLRTDDTEKPRTRDIVVLQTPRTKLKVDLESLEDFSDQTEDRNPFSNGGQRGLTSISQPANGINVHGGHEDEKIDNSVHRDEEKTSQRQRLKESIRNSIRSRTKEKDRSESKFPHFRPSSSSEKPSSSKELKLKRRKIARKPKVSEQSVKDEEIDQEESPFPNFPSSSATERPRLSKTLNSLESSPERVNSAVEKKRINSDFLKSKRRQRIESNSRKNILAKIKENRVRTKTRGRSKDTTEENESTKADDLNEDRITPEKFSKSSNQISDIQQSRVPPLNAAKALASENKKETFRNRPLHHVNAIDSRPEQNTKSFFQEVHLQPQLDNLSEENNPALLPVLPNFINALAPDLMPGPIRPEPLPQINDPIKEASQRPEPVPLPPSRDQDPELLPNFDHFAVISSTPSPGRRKNVQPKVVTPQTSRPFIPLFTGLPDNARIPMTTRMPIVSIAHNSGISPSSIPHLAPPEVINRENEVKNKDPRLFSSHINLEGTPEIPITSPIPQNVFLQTTTPQPTTVTEQQFIQVVTTTPFQTTTQQTFPPTTSQFQETIANTAPPVTLKSTTLEAFDPNVGIGVNFPGQPRGNGFRDNPLLQRPLGNVEEGIKYQPQEVFLPPNAVFPTNSHTPPSVNHNQFQDVDNSRDPKFIFDPLSFVDHPINDPKPTPLPVFQQRPDLSRPPPNIKIKPHPKLFDPNANGHFPPLPLNSQNAFDPRPNEIFHQEIGQRENVQSFSPLVNGNPPIKAQINSVNVPHEFQQVQNAHLPGQLQPVINQHAETNPQLLHESAFLHQVDIAPAINHRPNFHGPHIHPTVPTQQPPLFQSPTPSQQHFTNFLHSTPTTEAPGAFHQSNPNPHHNPQLAHFPALSQPQGNFPSPSPSPFHHANNHHVQHFAPVTNPTRVLQSTTPIPHLQENREHSHAFQDANPLPALEPNSPHHHAFDNQQDTAISPVTQPPALFHPTPSGKIVIEHYPSPSPVPAIWQQGSARTTTLSPFIHLSGKDRPQAVTIRPSTHPSEFYDLHPTLQPLRNLFTSPSPDQILPPSNHHQFVPSQHTTPAPIHGEVPHAVPPFGLTVTPHINSLGPTKLPHLHPSSRPFFQPAPRLAPALSHRPDKDINHHPRPAPAVRSGPTPTTPLPAIRHSSIASPGYYPHSAATPTAQKFYPNLRSVPTPESIVVSFHSTPPPGLRRPTARPAHEAEVHHPSGLPVPPTTPRPPFRFPDQPSFSNGHGRPPHSFVFPVSHRRMDMDEVNMINDTDMPKIKSKSSGGHEKLENLSSSQSSDTSQIL